jgi:hypothetical protein
MNMMRTLKPISIKVTPKKEEDLLGFTFSILDTSVEKKTKVSMIYKIIFFYHVDFARDILTYKKEEEI